MIADKNGFTTEAWRRGEKSGHFTAEEVAEEFAEGRQRPSLE